MKLFGIPLVYIVIAVGLLGIVTYSYYSYNKPAFVADDTLKCQRTYDFSQVKFTTEAKLDWEKCYWSNETYYKRGDEVYCTTIPEDSCDICAGVLAFKYNNTDYCELSRSCGFSEESIVACKNATLGLPFKPIVSQTSELDKIMVRANSVYPEGKNIKPRELKNGYWIYFN